VLASLPRLDRHKPKWPPVRQVEGGTRRAGVLIAVHVLIGRAHLALVDDRARR
jgi:hypothetical protein